jgi:hypothetical protein
LAKFHTAFAEPDVAFQVYNHYFAAAAFGNIKISHFYFPLIFIRQAQKSSLLHKRRAALYCPTRPFKMPKELLDAYRSNGKAIRLAVFLSAF